MNELKCKYKNKCGACQLLDLSYEKTIEYKKKYVLDSLRKEGITKEIDGVIPSSNPYHYRNKMIISYSYKKGKLSSGFFEEDSHNVIDIDECMMHSDLQNEIARYINKLIADFKVKIYDEDKRIGLLRYVIIKEAVKTKEILIVFVTSDNMFPSRREIVKRIVERFKEVKSIVQNINPRKTSIILGDKEEVLFGKPYITDELMGLKFQIGSKTFYQTNPRQCENLYQLIYDICKNKHFDRAIDAYSGIGTIGMAISNCVNEVVSVENNKQSVKNAILNAKLNNIKNVNFVCDDATEFINNIDRANGIDCIILDPPRAGSTEKFLDSVNAIFPKTIIYVSCNPETLSRDLKYLLNKNKYRIDSLNLVDMFCFSKHVESVCLLTNRAGNTGKNML